MSPLPVFGSNYGENVRFPVPMPAKTTMMRESFKLATSGLIARDAIAEKKEHSYEQFRALVSHNLRSPLMGK